MNNTAVLNRIENGRYYLMHIKDYGLKDNTERAFWNIKDLEFEAENPLCLELNKGDAVEFNIPEGKTILASFVILILPLLVFLLTFLILDFSGLDSEKLKALISIAAMTLSFFLTNFLKKRGFKETLPRIVKLVTKEKLLSLKSSCSTCGSCSACD